ncbi:hypothetical protein EDB84DRAFT_494791 [Lactarius hengduanensis]|nr:hypothetical protein EDB84DRAFT_494791 [Lactarius hengduanensis]
MLSIFQSLLSVSCVESNSEAGASLGITMNGRILFLFIPSDVVFRNGITLTGLGFPEIYLKNLNPKIKWRTWYYCKNLLSSIWPKCCVVTSPPNEWSSYPLRENLGHFLVVLFRRLTFSDLLSTYLPFWSNPGEISIPMIGRNHLPCAFHRPTDSPVRN